MHKETTTYPDTNFSRMSPIIRHPATCVQLLLRLRLRLESLPLLTDMDEFEDVDRCLRGARSPRGSGLGERVSLRPRWSSLSCCAGDLDIGERDGDRDGERRRSRRISWGGLSLSLRSRSLECRG